MPFIPHTDADIEEMSAAIGIDSVEELFAEIPSSLRCNPDDSFLSTRSEMAVGQLLQQRAQQDGTPTCFVGAGAYDHHIPAAVWDIATRGEFYSAYTPYQAEASQGTLQLIYEFQSMIAALTGLEVSNASLYDGASGLAEAVLMAVRANRQVKSARILVPETLNPVWRQVIHTLVKEQGIELELIPFAEDSGVSDLSQLPDQEYAAVVVVNPNFFGGYESIDALTDWAHARNALVIGVVNPISLALLKPPGEWGESGADIAVGEGQPLGIPMSAGGPFLGFLACKQVLVRQMPGRIVGKTVDLDSKPGFTLTLQAREQHIRRSRATSNICTNQGLMATAATIYMATMGPEGIEQVAKASVRNTHLLAERMQTVKGISRVFTSPSFHEVVLRFDRSVEPIQRALAAQDVLLGYHLGSEFPALENCLLLCATEKRSKEEIERVVTHLQRIMKPKSGLESCPKKVPVNAAELGFNMQRGE